MSVGSEERGSPLDRKSARREEKSARGSAKATRSHAKVKGPGNHADLYLRPDTASDQPLIVFNHIRKTGGTSLRHLIRANHANAELESAPRPAGVDPREWYADLYARHGQRLACVAGHHAGLLLAVVEDRPVRGLVMLRDAVDCVLSYYYFMVDRRAQAHGRVATLEHYFARFVAKPWRRIERGGLCNGQSRALLESHYEHRDLPLLADHRDADLWRERLFEVVDRHYLVGLQDRFLESVRLFAREFEWTEVFEMRRRANSSRGEAEPVREETINEIRRYNWLDDELYRRAAERFEST